MKLPKGNDTPRPKSPFVKWYLADPPPEPGRYIIATDDGVWIADYENGEWVDDEGWEPDVYAWTYLPELPKKP